MTGYRHGDIMDMDAPCKRCQHRKGVVMMVEKGPHTFGLYCENCNYNAKWLPKIENIGKNRRSKSAKIAKAQRGYCEICLRDAVQLPPRNGLEGHHIIPVRFGGDDNQENISTLCTRCHRMIEWYRTTIWQIIEPYIMQSAA